MKSTFFLAIVAAAMVPMLTSAAPTNAYKDEQAHPHPHPHPHPHSHPHPYPPPPSGLQCTTRWKGNLNVITRSSFKQIGGIALGDDDQETLVIEQGSVVTKQSFTFSECHVQGWNSGDNGSFGIIQASDDVEFNAAYGCVTARNDDIHRFTIDTCATDGGDAKLTFQLFQVNTEGISRDDFAFAELVGGPTKEYQFPNAKQIEYEGQTAVVATSEFTNQVLAFHDVEYVLRSN